MMLRVMSCSRKLINLLCDTVLVYAYAVQRPTVDAKLVEEAARDKQKGGLFQRPQKSA